jgi:hypothetical protein
MSEPKKDSVEMESITEHTYNGGSYKPGDTFSVEGDGGAWSAEMMADSLTAIGHATRVSKKSKKKDEPEVRTRQEVHSTSSRWAPRI